MMAVFSIAAIVLFADQCYAGAVHSERVNPAEIEFHISNHGTIARNETAEYPDWQGLKFPADSLYPLVYSGGLWLYALVDGEPRVAISESSTEFAAGPFGHEPIQDSSVFRVYRIVDGDESDSDYVEWPSDFGAPTDELGDPLLTGQQSLWTVFNDGALVYHNRRGGSTDPLDAEVQVYAYAFTGGDLDNVAYVEFTIINESEKNWDFFTASIQFDPDIGFHADDLCGTDSAMSMAFCYSNRDPIEFPPNYYPAVGVAAIETPTSGTALPPLVAANALIDVYTSRSVDMTEALMKGLQADGSPQVNPITGNTTRFPLGGNPVSGTGWVDEGKGDRKLMLSTWPVDVAAGDTVRMKYAFFAADGVTNVEALTQLFDVARSAIDFGRRGATDLTIVQNPADGSITDVSFSPSEHLWFSGHDWGGETFGGGIGWAGDLWGSSLDRQSNLDVEIVFRPDGGQRAARYVRQSSDFVYADFVTVPFDCRRFSGFDDLSDLAFIDSDGDGEWEAADDTASPHEYLFVIQSQYTGMPLNAFESVVLPDEADELPLLYAISLVENENARVGIRDGQILSINVNELWSPLESDTLDFGSAIVGRSKDLPLSLSTEYEFEKTLSFAIDSLDCFRIPCESATLQPGVESRSRIAFAPSDTGLYQANLMIRLHEFDAVAKELVLVGRGAPWSLKGDVNLDGVLDLGDITRLIRYLYIPNGSLPAGADVDFDSSGDIELNDLVMLINRVFLLDRR